MKVKELIHFLKSIPQDEEIEELEMRIDRKLITIKDIVNINDTVVVSSLGYKISKDSSIGK